MFKTIYKDKVEFQRSGCGLPSQADQSSSLKPRSLFHDLLASTCRMKIQYSVTLIHVILIPYVGYLLCFCIDLFYLAGIKMFKKSVCGSQSNIRVFVLCSCTNRHLRNILDMPKVSDIAFSCHKKMVHVLNG